MLFLWSPDLPVRLSENLAGPLTHAPGSFNICQSHSPCRFMYSVLFPVNMTTREGSDETEEDGISHLMKLDNASLFNVAS